jgi:hypothetical protein
MQPLKYGPAPTRGSWPPAGRLASSLLLVLLLLGATLQNERLYVLFDAWWYRLIGALGFSGGLRSSHSTVSPLLDHARSLPAVVIYGGLYLSLCLGLLFLLVPAGKPWQLVLRFYIGAGLATGLLVLGSRVGGGPALAVLASQILHFVVSPLPVIMLVPLLRWSASQAGT